MKLENYINKYGLEEGTRRHAEWKKNLAFSRTLPGYIQKYGEEEGRKRYLNKNSHLSVGIKALRAKGLSEEEIQEIRDKHKSSSRITLETLVLKYGKEEGEKRWAVRCQKAKITSCRRPEYWMLRGLTRDEAQEKVREIQTFNLDRFISIHGEDQGPILYSLYCQSKINTQNNFIQRYGEIEGSSRWETYLDRLCFVRSKDYYLNLLGKEEGGRVWEALCRSKAHTLKTYQDKYGEEEGSERYQIWLAHNLETSVKAMWDTQGVSKAEKAWANGIQKRLTEEEGENLFYYNRLKFINVPESHYEEVGQKAILPDILYPPSKSVLEFFGDYWHSQPGVPERDKRKEDFLRSIGYRRLIIWESEWVRDPQECINRCVSFIRRENESM